MIRLVGILSLVVLMVGCKSQKKVASDYEAFLADTQNASADVETSGNNPPELKGGTPELNKETLEEKKNEITWPADTAESLEAEETKIVVKEEEATLLDGEDVAMDEFKYHVIIGSFANEINARNYKQTMIDKGFTPTILENNSGYYRVSVFQTQTEADARQRIKTIRRNYPKHQDVWLLNRMM